MWLKEIFGEEKPVIGILHIKALPGTPLYDINMGLEGIMKLARADYISLVRGGISGVIFCNEYDKPYSKQVEPNIIACMTSIVKECLRDNEIIPFGIDVQWDPKAALAIALATGASFIRGIVCGTYCGDYGMYCPNIEEIINYKKKIKADNIKILTNLSPEFSYSIDNRDISLRAKTVTKSSLVDALCVSGVMAGVQAPYEEIKNIKNTVGDFPIIANTGVNFENVRDILDIADGCCVATCIKVDGNSLNSMDEKRVRKLMKIVRGNNI